MPQSRRRRGCALRGNYWPGDVVSALASGDSEICRMPPSGLLELLFYLARHRFCLAEGGAKRGLLRQVGGSHELSLVLLRYEPEVEVGRALHHCQVIDALDPGGGLDCRDQPVEDRTELGTLIWRHVAEIQQMPPGFDNDRSGAGLLQRGVLGEEVLALDDVASRPGDVQERRPRFQVILLPADVAVRPVIIRSRADLHRTLTGWLLRRDGH